MNTEVKTGTSSLGQGADVVNAQTVYTTHNYQDQYDLGRVFVACDTTGLTDDQHWNGTIWKCGSYSYTTVIGANATVPKFTTDSKVAYGIFFPSQPPQSVSVSGK